MKPIVPWVGGTNIPRETISISDVLGIGTSSTPGNNVNSIKLNLGVGYTGESYTQDALLFNSPGITSVPLGPGTFNTSGIFVGSNTSPFSTQAVSVVRNDQHIVLGVRDTRTQFTAGNLEPGETAVYATGSTARTVYKNDGSITHLTTSDDGKSAIYQQLSPTGWTLFMPFGKIVFDATGFHMSLASGAQFHMGGLNAPGPLSGLSSFISMSAGMISLPAATVNLGLAGPQGYSQALFSTAPEPPGVTQLAGPVTIPFTPSQSIFVGA
jgi:hypothetical protein